MAIGVGAALLLGGGGTLASWNASQNSSAGIIAAGDLNLVAKDATWTSDKSGDITAKMKAGAYKVVPGEKLTYTQRMDVTLSGDRISASLTATGPTNGDANGAGGFNEKNVGVSVISLKKGGAAVANPLTSTVTDVEASVTFEFKADTANRDSANAKYNFNSVAFTLAQNAPVAAPAAP